MLFNYVNKKFLPVINEYASIEAKNVSTYIINKTISDCMTDSFDLNEFFVISKNNNNEINSIDFNPLMVNRFLTGITDIIHNKIHDLEEGNIDVLDLDSASYYKSFNKGKNGVLFEIPSGVVFNNSLLSNLGPRVPVKITFVGDISSKIETKVTNYGINNALIEIGLHLNLSEKVVLPMNVSQVSVDTTVPIFIKLIQGSIPSYYLNGLNGSSQTLTVPVE